MVQGNLSKINIYRQYKFLVVASWDFFSCGATNSSVALLY